MGAGAAGRGVGSAGRTPRSSLDRRRPPDKDINRQRPAIRRVLYEILGILQGLQKAMHGIVRRIGVHLDESGGVIAIYGRVAGDTEDDPR